MKIHSIYCSRDSFYACSVKNVLFCFMSYCSCLFMDFVKKLSKNLFYENLCIPEWIMWWEARISCRGPRPA